MSTISINKSKVTKKGFITLYIRVRVDRRNISAPLNIKLKQNQWRGRVVNHSYASDLNRCINEEVARCYELLTLYEVKRLSYVQLYDQVRGQEKTYADILEGYLDEKPTPYRSAFNQYKTIVGAAEVRYFFFI